jgi:hypothetical protein
MVVDLQREDTDAIVVAIPLLVRCKREDLSNMEKIPKKLYLDLLKKSLSFTLWPEPPISIMAYNYQRSLIKRLIVAGISKVLKPFDLEIVKNINVTQDARIDGRIWPSYAETMIGLKRLDNLQSCIETVISEEIEGDLIEAGVWRGGACIFMRGVLAVYKIEDRRVFVADSFEGLPEPDVVNCPADKGVKRYTQPLLAVSKDDVEQNFRKYDLLDEQVVFLVGWFKDTLPNIPIERLSILRIDGDMYASTMDVLVNLYPKLSIGGFCIIDDYALEACRRAVNDYRSDQKIGTEMKEIDWTGRYWRKVE